jgi:tetratricopeptide (TPR) repeat protein
VVEAVNAAVARLDAGVLRAHPDTEAAVRRSIGATYQALDRLDLAQVQLREALRLSRVVYGEEHLETAYSMVELGWCDLYCQPINWSEVEKHLRQGVEMQRKLLGKSPGTADGLRRLSHMLLCQNNPVEAEKVAREALEVDPAGVGPLANALRDQRRYAEAERLYKQALSDARKSDGEKSAAVEGNLYELGMLFGTQGRFAEAEAAWSEALAIRRASGNDEVWLRTLLSRVLVPQGKFIDAEQVLREARRLSPQRAGLAFELANVLRRQSKEAEAAQAVQEGMFLWEEQKKDLLAAAHTPQKRAAIYLTLVEGHVNCGLWKEARDTFQKVVQLDSDDTVALNKFASSLVVIPRPEFHDPALGLQAAQRAVELAPDSAQYWNTLGIARYRTGDYAKAIDALEKSGALKGNGCFIDGALFISMAHFRLGHLDDALFWYTQASASMDQNEPDPLLKAFRAEAEALLGILTPTSRPSTTHPASPATAP